MVTFGDALTISPVQLSRIYRGDDGGASDLSQRGNILFGFAEHPGRGYAFVLKIVPPATFQEMKSGCLGIDGAAVGEIGQYLQEKRGHQKDGVLGKDVSLPDRGVCDDSLGVQWPRGVVGRYPSRRI